MNKYSRMLLTLMLIAGWGAAAFADDSRQIAVSPVPAPGRFTLVDLSAGKCIPCKMMAPILTELKTEYTGRVSIIFMDVWEHRRQSMRFRIRAIPTRIFYDATGQEALRHVGSMDKKSIVATFEKIDVSAKREH
jgi:thioredoxin 1